MNAALATFWGYVQMGGYVMPPLILAAMALWYAIGARSMKLRFRIDQPLRQLVQQAQRLALTEAPSAPLTRAALVGVQTQKRRHRNLRSHLDEAFAPIVAELTQFRGTIRAVVAVAPLLGLLGTVSGMIETFDSLGNMTLFSQSGGIAGGISQALLTTQFGLPIAIPGLILRGLLERRQTALEGKLEELKEILCAGQPDMAETTP